MKIVLWSVFLFLAVGFSQAQQPKKKSNFKEQYDALAEEYRQKQDAFYDPKIRPKTQAERTKAANEERQFLNDYSVKFYNLAKTAPKEKDALACIGFSYNFGSNAQKEACIQFAIEHHADDLISASLMGDYVSNQYSNFDDYVKQLAAKTNSRSIKGIVLLLPLDRKIMNYDPKMPEAERIKLVDTTLQEIRSLLKEYGNEKNLAPESVQATVSEIYRETVYLAENLDLGRQAPDFEATSLADGKKHKLSDYRGKIVILDFYEYAESSSRTGMAFAHKTTLHLYKDQPVQVISVLLNKDKKFAEENSTWTHLWASDQSKIEDRYLLKARSPSRFYILDAKGIIRAKRIKGRDVDPVIEKLLKEMKK